MSIMGIFSANMESQWTLSMKFYYSIATSYNSCKTVADDNFVLQGTAYWPIMYATHAFLWDCINLTTSSVNESPPIHPTKVTTKNIYLIY